MLLINCCSDSYLEWTACVIANSEKPGKPDPPEITSTSNSTISLAYKPPTDDGGAEIINYVIEYREEGLMKWTRANKETVNKTSYTVLGLKKDTEYEFRVAAENKAGVGPASDPSKPSAAKEIICKYFSWVWFGCLKFDFQLICTLVLPKYFDFQISSFGKIFFEYSVLWHFYTICYFFSICSYWNFNYLRYI